MSEKPPDIWNLKYFDPRKKIESLKEEINLNEDIILNAYCKNRTF